MVAGSRDPERSIHIDADHMTARREPQLALAGKQHVPGLMLLAADQGVLAVGSELTVCSGRRAVRRRGRPGSIRALHPAGSASGQRP
jgi:hypothetical protein